MTKLRLSPDLIFPDDVVTSTLVVYGGKGMGKTNFGSVLVEELQKARLRWCVLDPMGVWWGLRHSKDGKGPGIECVILGGAHGDIPIEPTGGAIVADLVVDENVNTIVDFSRKKTGQMWTVGEKIRFVTEYTLRLFQRQGELIDGRRREPLMQILDESARYIPQTIPSGAVDLAKCVGAWEQVCEEGRNIGLGVGFLTQRSARMNKSVSELADVMVAFRTIGPNSLAAIMDWLGEHVEKARIRELAARVRELEIGQALVVSPGWLRVEKVVQIRERETFDSSATPKPGQRAQKVSGKAAKPDLAKYEAKMAETIEKVKADDPKELRRRIAELERAAKQAPATTARKAIADPRAIERAVKDAVRAKDATITSLRKAVEAAVKFIISINTQSYDVAGVDKAELERAVSAALEKATQIVDQRLGARARQMEQLRLQAQRIAASLTAALGDDTAEIAVNVTKNEPFTVARPRPLPPASSRSFAPASGNGDGTLPKGERIVLTAIAQQPDGGADRAQLTVLTGYKRSSRDSYISRLGEKGYVEVRGDRVVATQGGVDALGADFEPLPIGEALREYWLGRLPEGERKILASLAEAYPDAVPREVLSDATGYKRSSRDSYISRLGARKLVESVDGGVRANDSLFDGAGR